MAKNDSTKIETKVKDLQNAVGVAFRCTAKKTVEGQGLFGSSLFVQPEKGAITVTGTDHIVGASVRVDAKVTGKDSVVLSGRKFHDVVKALAGADVVLTSKGVIKAGKSQFRLKSSDGADYPEMPQPEGDTVKLKGQDLASALGAVRMATCNDSSRPHLDGVLLEFDGEVLRTVATDGHRLARAQLKLEADTKLKKGMFLPSRGVNEVQNFAASCNELEVTISKAHMHLEAVGDKDIDMKLWVRLGDNAFPPYNRVIPEGAQRTASVKREDFIDAVHRVGLCVEGRGAGLRLVVEKDAIVLTGESSGLGDAREEVPATIEGEGSVMIAFSERLLAEGLKGCTGDEVRFQLGGELDPGVLANEDDFDFVYVIMPLRLDQVA